MAARPATAPPVGRSGASGAAPRRRLGLAALGLASGLPALLATAGCGVLSPMAPLPAGGSTAASRRRLARLADAHGAAAFRRLHDINPAFCGLPLSLPMPVELRGLLRRGLLRGHRPSPALDWLRRLPGDYGLPPGPAIVAWQPDAAASEKPDAAAGEKPDAAAGEKPGPAAAGATADRAAWLAPLALATDLVWVALLGPLLFIDTALDMDESAPLWIDGRRCDGLRLRRAAAAGEPAAPDYALYADPVSGLVRRLSCQPPGGSLVWLDAAEPIDRHGIRWPTRFVLWRTGVDRVAEAPSHWTLTGLDVDRLYGLGDVQLPGPLRGRAAAPAEPIGG